MSKKVCNKCKIEKQVNEFHKSGFQPNGKQKYKANCKPCQNIIDKNKKYEKLFSLLEELNIDLKCKNCGYSKNFAALEFHHKEPKLKNFRITERNYIAKEKLRCEILKCDILCSNCHRELHNPQLNI